MIAVSPGLVFRSASLKLKTKTAKSLKNKNKLMPPLTRLPSFNTNAIILGFVVYSNEVSKWLLRLSKNAGRYFKSHEEILRAFLVAKPELGITIRYGDAFCEQKYAFPTQAEFQEATHYKEYGRLS